MLIADRINVITLYQDAGIFLGVVRIYPPEMRVNERMYLAVTAVGIEVNRFDQKVGGQCQMPRLYLVAVAMRG